MASKGVPPVKPATGVGAGEVEPRDLGAKVVPSGPRPERVDLTPGIDHGPGSIPSKGKQPPSDAGDGAPGNCGRSSTRRR